MSISMTGDTHIGFRPDGMVARHPHDPHIAVVRIPQGGTVHPSLRMSLTYIVLNTDSISRARASLKDLYKRLQGKASRSTEPFGPEVDGIIWAIQENWWRAWGVELQVSGIPKSCVRLTTDGMYFTDLDQYPVDAPSEVMVELYTSPGLRVG